MTSAGANLEVEKVVGVRKKHHFVPAFQIASWMGDDKQVYEMRLVK